MVIGAAHCPPGRVKVLLSYQQQRKVGLGLGRPAAVPIADVGENAARLQCVVE